MPVRLFSTPHLPTTAKQVALSIALSAGVTLSSADATLLTVGAAADVWCVTHYLQQVLLVLRQWILNAEVGDASVSPLGGNPGSLANVNLTGVFTLSETAGASRVVITLTSIGINEANTLTSITLDNTSGWLTPLGFWEDTTLRTYNASSGTITITGDFQPKTMHVFPRSEQDTGDRRIKPMRNTLPLGDGDLSQHDIGNVRIERDYKLIDLGPDHCGPGFPVARWSAWGVTRKAITCKSLAVSPTAFDSMGAYALLSVGDYIKIGNIEFTARVKAVNTTTVGGVIYLTSIDLWEPFPSTVAPVVGDEIEVISEAAAMDMQAGLTKHLIVFNQDDSTDTPNQGTFKDYALRGKGETEEGYEHGQVTEPLFSWNYPLLKYRKNKLTLPT